MSAALQSRMDRRSFLKLATMAGGGLVIGHYVRPDAAAETAKPDVEKVGDLFIPNVFIRIATDGTVTIFSARPEVGQGIKTSLPMVVAEELGADWKNVSVVSGQLDPAFGPQFAGGSMSTPMSYTEMRKMGATARTMLVEAAAQTWSVPASECQAEAGTVRHVPTGRTLKFGDLVAKASTLPVPAPEAVTLKDPKDFTLLGKAGRRRRQSQGGDRQAALRDRPEAARHGVRGLCEEPGLGGSRAGANLDQVKGLPGVRDAFIVDRTVPAGQITGLVPGVAIIADSTWSAFSARQQLKVTWEDGAFPNSSWDDFGRQARTLAAAGAEAPNVKEARRDGDVDQAFQGAAHVVEASYSYPFISHANLEPQNCLARGPRRPRGDLGPDAEPGRG
jgi:isoquinoline 1-oxidoreductase beta subunit